MNATLPFAFCLRFFIFIIKMLVNFNELKRLSSIKNDIKQDNRSKKVIDLDTHHEMRKLYRPVIDPLQEIVKDQKAISRAIEVGP